MDVYYNGNETVWGRGKQKDRLSKISVCQTVFWEEQELYIPAVYVGVAGVILDVCAKLDPQDMIAFLKKWDKKKRVSLHTVEEYEQFEAENPSCMKFAVELRLNKSSLAQRVRSSLCWYSQDVILHTEPEETLSAAKLAADTTPDVDRRHFSNTWENDLDAEMLRSAYGCDQNCCWYFGRFVYHWTDNVVLSPQEITLLFRECPHSVTTEYFTTVSGSRQLPEDILTIHPTTGQEYRITLHECRLTRHSFAKIGAEGISYPEYAQTLLYSISPAIDPDLFDIRDCADGDHPRKTSDPQTTYGHTAAFVLPSSRKQLAISSMHFEPFTEVCWRTVFQVTQKREMEFRFSIL
ncbi:MAG: hypothetical protein K2O99_11620 [Lachnospiraceae bacterium]|nr:hypothetical protein [Lachnospiraceae bacterium]